VKTRFGRSRWRGGRYSVLDLVMSKNSIAGEMPALTPHSGTRVTTMIPCGDAKNSGSVPGAARRRCRVDEPRTTADHRILREENRVLRAQIGDRRLRFDDDQRRRLAVRAKMLGRQVLAEVATIVTPETLLSWHRKLISPEVL